MVWTWYLIWRNLGWSRSSRGWFNSQTTRTFKALGVQNCVLCRLCFILIVRWSDWLSGIETQTQAPAPLIYGTISGTCFNLFRSLPTIRSQKVKLRGSLSIVGINKNWTLSWQFPSGEIWNSTKTFSTAWTVKMWTLSIFVISFLIAQAAEGSFPCEQQEDIGFKYGPCTCSPDNPNQLYCPEVFPVNQTVAVLVSREQLIVDCGNVVRPENLVDFLGSCPKLNEYLLKSDKGPGIVIL